MGPRVGGIDQGAVVRSHALFGGKRFSLGNGIGDAHGTRVDRSNGAEVNASARRGRGETVGGRGIAGSARSRLVVGGRLGRRGWGIGLASSTGRRLCRSRRWGSLGCLNQSQKMLTGSNLSKHTQRSKDTLDIGALFSHAVTCRKNTKRGAPSLQDALTAQSSRTREERSEPST